MYAVAVKVLTVNPANPTTKTVVGEEMLTRVIGKKEDC